MVDLSVCSRVRVIQMVPKDFQRVNKILYCTHWSLRAVAFVCQLGVNIPTPLLQFHRFQKLQYIRSIVSQLDEGWTSGFLDQLAVNNRDGRCDVLVDQEIRKEMVALRVAAFRAIYFVLVLYSARCD